ncbi:MAG: hypothetical protein QNJ68_18230 [Microcoleaceae cyanobacterium MO_207.B10]|nr:hypothetical protein [Microcoleaceae cyanobacterium MO_207.B10]
MFDIINSDRYIMKRNFSPDKSYFQIVICLILEKVNLSYLEFI